MTANRRNFPSWDIDVDALLDAWAKFAIYDNAAAHLARAGIRRRQWIIALTLISTFASVAALLVNRGELFIMVAIPSVMMPIIASYLMNDTLRSGTVASWMKYRYVAEHIRSHIYRYRANATSYADIPPERRVGEFKQHIRAAHELIQWDGVPPIIAKTSSDADAIRQYISAANAPNPKDDGISPLDIEAYLKYRLERQRRWYAQVIRGDFARTNNIVRQAQLAMLIGSILVALLTTVNPSLASIIVITNAISIALTQTANLIGYGKSYGIYQIAERQLADLQLEWFAKLDPYENLPASLRADETARFVERVEKVILWELEEWYDQSLLMLGSSTDDDSRAQFRARDAQNDS